MQPLYATLSRHSRSQAAGPAQKSKRRTQKEPASKQTTDTRGVGDQESGAQQVVVRELRRA